MLEPTNSLARPRGTTSEPRPVPGTFFPNEMFLVYSKIYIWIETLGLASFLFTRMLTLFMVKGFTRSPG